MAAAAAAASASAVDALHVPDTLAELVVGRVYSTHILFMAHSGTMMAFWPSPTVDKRVPIAWSDAAKLCMANGVKVGSPEAQIKLTGKPIEVTFKGYADHTTLIPVVNPSRNYDVSLTPEQRALQEEQLAANRAAAPPARGASLDALAAAEVRVIMHNLSVRELLRLARCSRRMRDMAQSPHAWRHAPALSVDPVASPAAFSTHLLLRHAPLNMRLRYAVRDETPEDLVKRLARFVAAHRVVSMETADDCGCTLTIPILTQLFADPAMQALRTLIFHDALSVSLWSSGSLLPLDNLQSIVVHPSGWKDRAIMVQQPGRNKKAAAAPVAPASAAAAPVDTSPVLRALTSASVVEDLYGDSVALPFFSRCPALRHLSFSVSESAIDVNPRSLWKQLIEPASFAAGLQRLVLTRFHAPMADGVVDAVQIASVFRALTSLSELILCECAGVESILPQVSLAPQLRQLTVQPVESVRQYNRPVVTAPEKLCAAAADRLRAAPSLRYTLVTFQRKQPGDATHVLPQGFGERCILVVLP